MSDPRSEPYDDATLAFLRREGKSPTTKRILATIAARDQRIEELEQQHATQANNVRVFREMHEQDYFGNKALRDEVRRLRGILRDLRRCGETIGGPNPEFVRGAEAAWRKVLSVIGAPSEPEPGKAPFVDLKGIAPDFTDGKPTDVWLRERWDGPQPQGLCQLPVEFGVPTPMPCGREQPCTVHTGCTHYEIRGYEVIYCNAPVTSGSQCAAHPMEP